MLFAHEVRMGESIDFQAPMKWACAAGEPLMTGRRLTCRTARFLNCSQHCTCCSLHMRAVL